MIWLILGLIPFVFGFLYMIIDDFWFVAGLLFWISFLGACFLLAAYGAWTMGWFDQCGNFWESFDCTGKVITN